MSRACGSCQAPIVWAVTENGKRIPVDRDPVDGGNIRLIPGLMWPTARVVGPQRDLFDRDDDGTRYVSHFATCAQASEHRRPR